LRLVKEAKYYWSYQSKFHDGHHRFAEAPESARPLAGQARIALHSFRMIERISEETARRIALRASGLLSVNDGSAVSTRDIVRRLGSVQIDTINVIERAHHHILWSRVPQYKQGDIQRLEREPRRIFEYWSHAAAYVPIEYYRFSMARMERIRAQGHEWFDVTPATVSRVSDRIRAEGPLRAADFKESRPGEGGWWSWKPAKIALEYLFHAGEIVVLTRKAFQKIYDLAERVMPDSLGESAPSPGELAAHYVDMAVSALGIFAEREVAYMRKDGKEGIPAEIASRVEAGRLLGLRLDGRTYYCSPAALTEGESFEGESEPSIAILSPFDPLIIDRRRAARILGCSYTLECYLPESKRTFGYFALPIIFTDAKGRSSFAGLMDAKTERREKTLVVKRLTLRPGGREFIAALSGAIARFAAFNGSERIEITRVDCEQARLERSLRLAVSKLSKQARG
jgi:uncharacterized protein YcaQ